MKKQHILSLIVLWVCMMLVMSGCTRDDGFAKETNAGQTSNNSQSGQSAVSTLLDAPAPASQRVPVQVASALRTGIFAQTRYLNVPAHFQISLYARVPAARFMALTPDGNLLVSQTGAGKVLLVRPASNGAGPVISTFVSGLHNPQDIVFHAIGSTMYMYLSEENEIDRFPYQNGDVKARQRQVIVRNLPDASLPELKGAYAHALKGIALDAQNNLYVSIGSSCNACTSDRLATPVRGSIYKANADGSNWHLYASGIRNAEGLAFVPGTSNLWMVVNNRDQIAYPFQNRTGPYKKVITHYVDNHPPEEFARVRADANYGWPFCNPDPDAGVNHMPFDRDVQFNADGRVNCNAMTRIDKGIQAHSAPLGLTFLPDPTGAGRSGALVGLHGSWDRSILTGYKVVYFPWNVQRQQPEQQIDLVTGWITGSKTAWGRPVDTVVDAQGNIFISDDRAGAIYQLSYQG